MEGFKKSVDENDFIQRYLILKGKEPIEAEYVPDGNDGISYGDIDFDKVFQWTKGNNTLKGYLWKLATFLKQRLQNGQKSIIAISPDESVWVLENVPFTHLFCSADIPKLVSAPNFL